MLEFDHKQEDKNKFKQLSYPIIKIYIYYSNINWKM